MTDEQIGAAIAQAARTVQAPPELRRRLAEAPARPPRRFLRVPRLAIGGAVAATLAALVLLVTAGGPSVQDVADAALHPPTQAVPAGHGGYGSDRGWVTVGQRVDRVGGRRAVTIVYRRAGRGVHYTVLGGAPISRPDGRMVGIRGRRYTVLRDGGTSIVTWEQGGHTCVLASRAVGASGLLDFLRS